MSKVVTIVGASGFVGSAVRQRLSQGGVTVRTVSAPRVTGSVGTAPPSPAEIAGMAEVFRGSTTVVNAAGVSDALADSVETLDGANGLMPGLLARACVEAGARLVHISSAAVQGSKPSLDSSSDLRPFSAYSRSKVLGEHAVLAVGGDVCVYRPPGVHASSRQVTQSVARLARSSLSSVADPGTDNAPQALLDNVADAVAFLATWPGPLPTIVHHPSEGLTTAALLMTMGGHPPLLVPRPVARTVLSTAGALTGLLPWVAGVARRLEVLWFGQHQAASWLTEAGWVPPVGQDGWEGLATDEEGQAHD